MIVAEFVGRRSGRTERCASGLLDTPCKRRDSTDWTPDRPFRFGASLYRGEFYAEMLLGFFPTLSLALIYKAPAFYLENKAAVDAYVADCEVESKRYQDTAPPHRRSRS